MQTDIPEPIRNTNPRRVLLISLLTGAFLTAVLCYFAQILHQAWAERIAAPFALAGFAVNVHQGSLALTLVLMFVVFSFIAWLIVEGLGLRGRPRRPGTGR